MTWPINSVIDSVNNPLRASPVLRAPLMLRLLRWTGPDTWVDNHEKQMSGVRVHSHAGLCSLMAGLQLRFSAKEKSRWREKLAKTSGKRVPRGQHCSRRGRGQEHGKRVQVTRDARQGDEVQEKGHIFIFLGTSVAKSREMRQDEYTSLILQIKDWPTFLVKDQIVNTSGFLGCT